MNTAATRYVRQMRKKYTHYSLVLQANDMAHALSECSMAAIRALKPQAEINRLLHVHRKAIKRHTRRSDNYNRFNTYLLGFIR